jgi:hypothetical protein
MRWGVTLLISARAGIATPAGQSIRHPRQSPHGAPPLPATPRAYLIVNCTTVLFAGLLAFTTFHTST